MIKIIDRMSGEIVAEYSKKNIRYVPSADDIEKLRLMGKGSYFIIELKGMSSSMAWWSADKYSITK